MNIPLTKLTLALRRRGHLRQVLNEIAKEVYNQFRTLSENCEHREPEENSAGEWGFTCTESDVECAVELCPLLQEEGGK